MGNCINCVRSHPQLHGCSDALIDSFCAGKAAKPHIVMARLEPRSLTPPHSVSLTASNLVKCDRPCNFEID